MSAGEVVGLALTAGLVSGVVGAVLVAVITSQRHWDAQRHGRQIDAYAEWLAARLTLSRACESFVAAFRAIAAEPGDSAYFSLRTEEVRRARSQWCDAARQLDLAEAALLAWSTDRSIIERKVPSDRIGADALRQAINSDERDVDRLLQELRTADRLAIDYVRNATVDVDPQGRLSMWHEILAKAAAHIESIVKRWGARS